MTRPPRRRRDEMITMMPAKEEGAGEDMALASMIVGIISIPLEDAAVAFSASVSITAIILGFVARRRPERASQRRYHLRSSSRLCLDVMRFITLANPKAISTPSRQFNK